LILGKEFGNRGHQVNARLLFGWLSEIAVGQLIGCNKGGYLTQHTAHSVTRKMKRCNTSSPHVFFPGSFGSQFCSPWGLTPGHLIEETLPWLIGGRKLGGKFLNSKRRGSIR